MKRKRAGKYLTLYVRQLEDFINHPSEKTWQAIEELHKTDCDIYRATTHCNDCPWFGADTDCLSKDLANEWSVAQRHVAAVEHLTLLKTNYLL